MKRTRLISEPLCVSPTLARLSSAPCGVWVIVIMSISSNSPSRISSGLPRMNSNSPRARLASLSSTVMHSSAGTANSTTSPSRWSMTAQTQPCADHRGDLCIVPAAMRRPRRGIGDGALRDEKAVHLPQDANRQRTPASLHPRLDPGQRQTSAILQPHAGELIGDVGSGLRLAEADFWMLQDVLADLDDMAGLPIDLGADERLEFFFGHVVLSRRLV